MYVNNICKSGPPSILPNFNCLEVTQKSEMQTMIAGCTT